MNLDGKKSDATEKKTGSHPQHPNILIWDGAPVRSRAVGSMSGQFHLRRKLALAIPGSRRSNGESRGWSPGNGGSLAPWRPQAA